MGETPLVTIYPVGWKRDFAAEYTDKNHDMLWEEIDEADSRALPDLEETFTGDYSDRNPRLQMSPEQRDYFQTLLLHQILTELRMLRAHLIRFYRDVT
jgi:hypothetical protein